MKIRNMKILRSITLMLGFIVFPIIITLSFLLFNLMPVVLARYPLFYAYLSGYQFSVRNLPFYLYDSDWAYLTSTDPPYGSVSIPEIEGVSVTIARPPFPPPSLEYPAPYRVYDNRLYFSVDDIDSLLSEPMKYFDLIVEGVVDLYKYNYLDFNDYSDFSSLSSNRGYFESLTSLSTLLDYNERRLNSAIFTHSTVMGLNIFVTILILLNMSKNFSKKDLKSYPK